MDVDVKTRAGIVRGRVVDGVATFKGIPYAAAPFGANRFQPPRPVSPWDGVREAFHYGPTVSKPPYFPPFDSLLPEPAIPGEECLNLNIWSPEPGQSGLPVMVWIHGGAFANGTGAIPTYEGSRFARDGVLCVTINYRLGVDGFLYLGDGIANLGLLDQIAALTWVQENIAAFGGDPQNVTLFGQSAGGMSISTLLSISRTAGLFRRAIAQSGGGQFVLTPATALKVSAYLAEKLGVEPVRGAIAAVSTDRLLQAQLEVSAEIFARPDPQRWGELAANLMPFEPVIDGEIITAVPLENIRAGAGANVDLMLGTTTEEQRLFMVPNGSIDVITDAILAGSVAAYGLPDETLATYKSSRQGASAGDLLIAIITDWFYRIPAIRMAEAHTQGSSKTYMYEFAWRSPNFDGRLGACHALEIPFVFDTLNKDGYERMQGSNPPQELADVMHAAWVSFATKGNPGWPEYDTSRRATMHFDTATQLLNDPGSEERLLWEGLR